ncbi:MULTISPECIES: GntR family transcriptional regulator [unclassified Bacillus (in: firmicutes)]|uniref:GntR family transcriptional regulator n=1 Tax=unclassified Bacillus (in: firmicutes) TaxID=185979 RepID=UPI00066037AC|nr:MULTISPECIES: GntR family transcriptional regulator [unclassified Bacillus (in: firmicutes)]CAI9395096.1 HTH-type transcriptional repressor RspR [Bacillus sp. T2.9-1]
MLIEVQAKLPGENNRDYSYRLIKEAIMSLRLKPGQSLSETEIAEALHISRTPIREVIMKLREEHLVEVIPQVGTYISKFKPILIEEAIFARIILEKEILKQSCISFPKNVLVEMKNNIAHQELLLDQKGMELEFHKLDKQFHFLIFQGNNKENVWNSIIRLSTHYNRMRLLAEMNLSFSDAILQHKTIVKMIESKNIDQVEAIIREHIIEPTKLWEDLYKPTSPYVDFFDLTNKMPIF